jgi:predicted amidophosphoribosyltransferase
MKTCPNGHFVTSLKNFCMECGAQLFQTPDKVCVCGQVLVKDQKFCGQCGRKADTQ